MLHEWDTTSVDLYMSIWYKMGYHHHEWDYHEIILGWLYSTNGRIAGKSKANNGIKTCDINGI